MGRVKTWILAGLIACAATSTPAANPELRIGVAVTEITPPVGHPIAGFGEQRVSESIHQPLWAKALVLSTGETTLALVVCDVHELRLPALVTRLRQELGIQHVLLSSTQSHSAPNLMEGGLSSPWLGSVQEKLFSLVARALEARFVARLGSAQRTVRLRGTSAPEALCNNVRIRQEDDTVLESWSVDPGEGASPTDPAVGVIRIDDLEGRTRVVLAHYGCQAAVLGPCSTAFSADWAGSLCRYVEEKQEGATCLFLSGGGANVFPFGSRSCGTEGFQRLQSLGTRLGEEVLGTLARIVPKERPRLQIAQREFQVQSDGSPGSRLQLFSLVIRLGEDLGILAAPASFFVEFQLNLRRRSPLSQTLLVGSAYLGGDSGGMVPTIGEVALGGWGTGDEVRMAVGSGEAIIDDALIQFHRFLGRVPDLPRGGLWLEIPDKPNP